MPHVPFHPSALKRQRQNLKREARNKAHKSRVRHAVNLALDAIGKGDAQAAEQAVRAATRELNKGASKGVVHRRAASRKVSRLWRRLHKSAQSATAPG
jgi:small subunit ribosomal protein S20